MLFIKSTKPDLNKNNYSQKIKIKNKRKKINGSIKE